MSCLFRVVILDQGAREHPERVIGERSGLRATLYDRGEAAKLAATLEADFGATVRIEQATILFGEPSGTRWRVIVNGEPRHVADESEARRHEAFHLTRGEAAIVQRAQVGPWEDA